MGDARSLTCPHRYRAVTVTRQYSEAELLRRYKPSASMTFANGAYSMTADGASKLTFGLVDFDRATETYHRVSCDPEVERTRIDEALGRSRHFESPPDLGNQPAALR